MPDTPPPTDLIGVWDRHRNGQLGNLLLLLGELAQQRTARNRRAELAVIGGPASDADGDPVWELLEHIEGLSALHRIDGPAALRKREHAGATIWPPLADIEDYSYDTTQRLQPLAAPAKTLTPVRIVGPPVIWARTMLAGLPGPSRVAVHLKSVAGAQSNADPEAWAAFFARHPTTGFALIGNDPVVEAVAGLDNVGIAARAGGRLVHFLALMQESDAFMGMMSGPCNFALTGDRPYSIFKNPDHHAAEMAIELGEGERYPFARPGQFVLRVAETPDRLTAALDRMRAESQA